MTYQKLAMKMGFENFRLVQLLGYRKQMWISIKIVTQKKYIYIQYI